MKKILSLALVLAMVLTMSVTAFAAEISDGSGSVDITYTYTEETPADSYIVTIPDSMTIGTDANVSVSDVTITAGYLLTVSVSSQQYNEGWKLINGDNTIGYTLKIDGTDIENNGTVLTAKNGDTEVSKTLVTALSGTPIYSGNYTDTLTFNVSVAECEHRYNNSICTHCGFRLTVDGALGDKTEATEEDVNALVDQLKAYVDSGNTTIIVTGETPAMIDTVSYTNTAIGEAIYRLSGSDVYDENNPYNGKIDLILPDVTEIVEWEFYNAFALNSITLPKVTTIGDQAFQGCYYLKQITFGSVVTSISQENGLQFVVGEKVGGCDLVLNCGQLQAEDTYKPDLENNVWFKPSWGDNVTWKNITLTHTGECDECNAAQ